MFLEPMLEPNCSCRNSTAQQLKVLIATVGLDTAVTACGSAVVNAFGLWTSQDGKSWKIKASHLPTLLTLLQACSKPQIHAFGRKIPLWSPRTIIYTKQALGTGHLVLPKKVRAAG